MLTVSASVRANKHEHRVGHTNTAMMQEVDSDRDLVLGEDESQDSTGEVCTDYANRHPDGCDSAILLAGSGVRHGGLPADA